MKFIFLLTYLCIASVFASTPIGKVSKIRGEATVLSPGQRNAKNVSQNDQIIEGSSIVTQDKSFMIVTFSDGSKITIGPNSKITVSKLKDTQKNIVGLLKGKLKAEIKKNNSKNNKFYVKTRTAAMGVRGTEFQTTYNPEGKTTSLLTFEGQVAMAKVDQAAPQSSAKVDKLLKKDRVLVNKGRYAGITPNLKKPSIPVVISPKQFTLLKVNKTFGVEKVELTKKEIQEEITKTEKEFSKLKLSEEEKKQTATFEKDTLKPRAGGLVDLNTGLYVPPQKEDNYNSKLNIYEATQKIGTINEDGNYVPPEGMRLDPVKGFIAKNNAVQSKTKELNQNISAQIVPSKVIKKNLDDLDDEDYEKYFKIED